MRAVRNAAEVRRAVLCAGGSCLAYEAADGRSCRSRATMAVRNPDNGTALAMCERHFAERTAKPARTPSGRTAKLDVGEAEALEVWIGLVGAEPVARALGIDDTALDQVRHSGPVTARLAERVREGMVSRG